ncbi:MAG: 3-phosphoshikimate 1-carboxyvinyltransferase [Bacillaceae bacterium]|nr:3-phosphoshikimate 1-carboxyvinyltransferase [Bacillaceae bacterium]
MMTVLPAKMIKGEVVVPGDKSISHRAVMFSSLAEGETEITGFLAGADCLSTIACFQKMGIEIKQVDDRVSVKGKGWFGLKEPHNILDVGNSGTTIRLMMGILSTQPFHSVLIGDESIARRPMSRVAGPLSKMGARIDGRQNGEYTPISMRGGGLSGIDFQSSVASAQVKSAILLAGIQAEGTTSVLEPYLSRDHTERMLSSFGVTLDRTENKVMIEGGQSLITPEKIEVPGDISSAAFLMVAATILSGSDLTIKNVGVNPTRSGIVDVLMNMGASIKLENQRIRNGEPVADIHIQSSDLKGIEIGGSLIPRLIDEIPVIAVLAAFAEGETVIRDAAELKVKETNRIETVVTELSKLGADIQATDDGMIIRGTGSLQGAVCQTHGDHRIGMAMAVAGLAARGNTIIEGEECINVSFPGFFNLLKKITIL